MKIASECPESVPRLRAASFGDARLPDRFWSKCAANDAGCWAWTGAMVHDGYGRFSIDQKTRRAHKVSYEALVGAVPDGLHLDHRCRNRACVNPAHLEPVTCRENLHRGATVNAMNAAKTHCQSGHEFTIENTYIRRNGRRTCLRGWWADAKQRARATP